MIVHILDDDGDCSLVAVVAHPHPHLSFVLAQDALAIRYLDEHRCTRVESNEQLLIPAHTQRGLTINPPTRLDFAANLGG